MKTIKKIIIVFVCIVSVIFLNGCYYVFRGQFKSVEKLSRGEELNLYERASVYSMHIAMCTAGSVLSPEAAREVFGMSFRRNRDSVIYRENNFFLSSDAISKIYRTQYTRKRISFPESSYSPGNKEHRVSLAANPGFLWRTGDTVYFEVPVRYPEVSETHIGPVVINEGLFHYLESRGILHPYTIIYMAAI